MSEDRDVVMAELIRQGVYVRDDGGTWLIDGDVDVDALVAVVRGEYPKAKAVPCPNPAAYDAGRCCGECLKPDNAIQSVRDILTAWNFGPMDDRKALVRILAYVGDNIQ